MPSHIKFSREVRTNSRRPVERRIPNAIRPENYEAFHGKITQDIESVKATNYSGAFDDRALVKFDFNRTIDPSVFSSLPGIEFISQETSNTLLVFSSDEGLRTFEEKLGTLIANETEVKSALRNTIYSVQELSGWTSENRKGYRLKKEPITQGVVITVDVQLWSVEENFQLKEKISYAFKAWLEEHNIHVIDSIENSFLLMYRVLASNEQLELLLNHRDIRLVDLPPSYEAESSILNIDVNNLATPAAVNTSALATVLDTGLMTNHPLIAPHVGEAASFLEDTTEADTHGHGTKVSGVAIYNDVEPMLGTGTLVPTLRILSGKVLTDTGELPDRYMPNIIEEAVDYFLENYGCKVFNISFGDRKAPYIGGHLRELAVTLDHLAKEKEVLFIVSAGNFNPESLFPNEPQKVKDEYPFYHLDREETKIIDPATAVNALTVGSIARYEADGSGDLSKLPIAQSNHISPFSRTGPSIRGTIKPEFVDYGGNAYTQPHLAYALNKQALGELVFKNNLTNGLFSRASGTSFAAPKITNYAARLFSTYPDATPDLVRAFLAVNASCPLSEDQCEVLKTNFNGKGLDFKPQNLFGYGRVSNESLFDSGSKICTLYAADSIDHDTNHFYELPIPESFLVTGNREREISVALAFTPTVRTTRLHYIMTRMRFKIFAAASLEEVQNIFSDSAASENAEEHFKSQRGWIGQSEREKGTLQASTFTFKAKRSLEGKKIFMVVTRQDYAWSEVSALKENYAIAIRYADRFLATADLHTQLQAQLNLRTQVQPRVRVQ